MEPNRANHDLGRLVELGINDSAVQLGANKNTSAKAAVSMLFLIRSVCEA
ncbi:hypothetical protein RISK_005500 [Rhodopirellula islandica]|uniref:Uncharacterized protein n=1 Tax=Rhodopirellula islandica TaxID=595434 RepID=A0A0J1EAB8_RHOIS|nr:hypothetical protein RISK_005500 [Rhodopirellula islandica]